MSELPRVVQSVPHLEQLGNVVPEDYAYREKLVTPGEDLSLPEAYLKWYDIHFPEVPITPEQGVECRAFLVSEVSRLGLGQELGFVLLHRAGPVLLLLLITWRNTNELWESVYVKDVEQSTGYTSLTFDKGRWGTYCVWELGPIMHERHAWVRFLSSARDESAKLAYINDRFSGLV